MMRTLFTIVAVSCLLIVLAEGAFVGWLWSQGRLTPTMVQDIKELLAGRMPSSVEADAPDADAAEIPTEEVMKARVVRLFDLGRREDEIALLKNLVAEQAKRVTTMQLELERKQKDFEKRLQELKSQNDEESVQQARTILQALQPVEAADTLMGLPPDRSLVVLRGMPEKSIARILKELARGDDKRIERGQKLFEALSDGEPTRSLINSATSSATTGSAAP